MKRCFAPRMPISIDTSSPSLAIDDQAGGMTGTNRARAWRRLLIDQRRVADVVFRQGRILAS